MGPIEKCVLNEAGQALKHCVSAMSHSGFASDLLHPTAMYRTAKDCVASIQFTMPDHAKTAVDRYDGGILEISPLAVMAAEFFGEGSSQAPHNMGAAFSFHYGPLLKSGPFDGFARNIDHSLYVSGMQQHFKLVA